MISPLFRNTAKHGLETALPMTIGVGPKELGPLFIDAIKSYYTPFLGDNLKENFIGKKIISEDNAGRMNISPAISPDGRYVIFLSDKNLFSTDLYLADAREGKILRKLNTIFRDGGIDDLNLLESAGTWSPDSKRFAYVAFSKGYNVILIKEPLSGSTIETIKVPGIPSIAHPAWSPDGNDIAFTGMVDGQTDLYVYNLKSKKVKQLTNDFFSEVYPDYSPDGKYLVFSSDRKTFEKGKENGRWTLHLSRIKLDDLSITDYDQIFPGADCINPAYDPEGNIYFVSDRDGFRNLYRYDFNEELFQMTDLKTGISGISRYSPAISVSKKTDKITFTHYFKSSYDIYQAKADRFLFKVVDPRDVHFEAGTLPVVDGEQTQIVKDNLERMDESPSAYTLTEKEYEGNFKLDYLFSGGLGVGTGGIGTRTGLAGGVGMIFSDILGNHQLYSTLAINGSVYDFGGAVQYLNQKSRIGWGFSISHIPSRAGFYGTPYRDTLEGEVPVIVQEENILRVFEDQVSGLVQLPFSKYLRLEGSLGMNYRFFRLDRTDLYYDEFGYFLGEGNRERVPLDDAINVGGFEIRKTVFYNNSIGLVGDKTQFGLASPINGYRFRFDVSNYFGGYNFQLATADMRYYRYTKPVTLAFRLMHYATLGPDSRNYYPVLIGDMGLVHAFDYSRLTEYQVKNGIAPQQLMGSKFFVSGLEVRLPFTGPEELALIKLGGFMTELSWFLDGGIAFNDYADLSKKEDSSVLPPKLVFSTGFSWRVNLFGALVVEPYFAWPLLENSKGKFGIFFVPGW
jgi:Tol biopolymer transport system component